MPNPSRCRGHEGSGFGALGGFGGLQSFRVLGFSFDRFKGRCTVLACAIRALTFQGFRVSVVGFSVSRAWGATVSRVRA